MAVHLDRTLSQSQDARERNRVSSWYDVLKGRTHFNNYELKCMLLLFNKMTSPERPFLTSQEFGYNLRVQFHILNPMILHRLYSVLERPNDPGIGYDQWVCLVSIYCRGSIAQKTILNWLVYDNTGAGSLNWDDILFLTVSHLGPYSTDEERNDYADDVLVLFDKDEDEVISYEDFATTVYEKPTALNTFGRVCPEPHVTNTFLSTFTSRYGERYQVKEGNPHHIDITTFRKTSTS